MHKYYMWDDLCDRYSLRNVPRIQFSDYYGELCTLWEKFYNDVKSLSCNCPLGMNMMCF